MIQFFVDNAATIIVSTVLLAMLALAVRYIVKRKKQAARCASGKTCVGCPYANNCH